MSVRRLAFVLSALLLGCGAERDATQKQVDELRAEVVKLRAENGALSERIDAIRLGNASVASLGGSGSADAGVLSDRPDLDVVKLTPELPGESDDAQDDGPRPVIRSTGVSIDKSKGKAGATGDDDYDRAYQLYKSKSYDKALDAFAALLVKSPDSANADLATFYRGECYFAKNDFKKAAEQFDAVASNFPKSPRAPDALLRLAQTQSKLNDKAGSDQTKKRLLSTYPTSDAARKLAPGKKP